MTDRHTGYLVVLDQPLREDDAEAILTAIRLIKGVQSATSIVRQPGSDMAAVMRQRSAIIKLLLDLCDRIGRVEI